MNGLSMFFKENVEVRPNRKVVVSERFKDENGKPLEWEIRSITVDEDDAIRKECTKRVPIVGKKGQFTQDFDSNTYILKLTATSIVNPNLNNEQLQNSWGVMSATQLLSKMLYADEYNALTEVIAEGVKTFQEDVEEAKN